MSDSQAETTSSGICTSSSSAGTETTSEPGTSKSSFSSSSSSSSSSKHPTKMVVEHKFSSSSREMRNMAEKMRRDKLNTYVAEIASIVPLGSGANKRIDKTSVLRLAANYIRMHKVLKDDDEASKVPPLLGREVTHSLAEAIGGFLLVVTSSGKVLYITEAVDQFFGHTQVDLLGHSIYNVIHPDDHEIFQQQLIPRGDNFRRSFFCRMMEKALSRNDPGRYEIIHVVGQLRSLPQMQLSSSITSPTTPSPVAPSPHESIASGDHDEDESSDNEGEMQPLKVANKTGTHMLVSFVRVVKDRPITELSLVESTQEEYITRHGMDGKILYTDHRISFVTGLMPCEVVGTSAFNYMHQDDILWSIVAQKLMFTSTQGQGIVSYRLKCKNGDLITLRSRGFLEVNKQTGQVESFVCINTVLSVKEASSEIKNQRRNLLPIIACHETDDHLGSISSALPPELLNAVKQIMNPHMMQKMIESLKGSDSFKEELGESIDIMPPDAEALLYTTTDHAGSAQSNNSDHCLGTLPFQTKPKRSHCENYEMSPRSFATSSCSEKDQWLRIAKKRANVDDFNTVVSKKFSFERDLSRPEPQTSCASDTSSQPYTPANSPFPCTSTSSVPENITIYSPGTCQQQNSCNSSGNSACNAGSPKSSEDFQNTGTRSSFTWQQNNPAMSPTAEPFDQSVMFSEKCDPLLSPEALSPMGYSKRAISHVPASTNYDQSKEEGFLSPGLGDLRTLDLANSPDQSISRGTTSMRKYNQSRMTSIPISSNVTPNRSEVVPSGGNFNVGSCNQSTSHNICQGLSTSSSYSCIDKKPDPSLEIIEQINTRNISSCLVPSQCSNQYSESIVTSPKDQQMLLSQNQLFPHYQQVSVCVSHTNMSPYPHHAFPSHDQSLTVPHQTPCTSSGHYSQYSSNLQKPNNSQERHLSSYPDSGHRSVPVTSSHKLSSGEPGMAGVPVLPEPIIPEQHSSHEDPLSKDAGSMFSNGHFQHYRSPSQQGGKLL